MNANEAAAGSPPPEKPSRFVETLHLSRARDTVRHTARLFRAMSLKDREHLAGEFTADGQPPLERLLGQALLEVEKDSDQGPHAAGKPVVEEPGLRKGFDLFTSRRPAYLKELVVKYRLRPIPPSAVALGGRICLSMEVLALFKDLKYEPREHIFVIHLAANNQILSVDELAVGCMTECTCSPADLFRNAMLAGAAAVIIVHNHPSGTPEPSRGDRQLMAEICPLGELLRLTVVDFVIIGDDRCWSASDHKQIQNGHYMPYGDPAPVPIRRGRPPKELQKAAGT